MGVFFIFEIQKVTLLLFENYLMKWFKRIVVVVLVIVSVPLIVALFVKKEYTVERAITIEKPTNYVFDYLVLLKNQDEFSVWAKIDPSMETYYEGIDGTVGFMAGWKSDNPDVGHGEQTILEIIQNERISYELKFIEPFQSISYAHLNLNNTSATSTQVVWTFEGKIPYPFNLMFLFTDFESMIGNDLESGLNNLKLILE
jgi:hypothetical protein